MKTRRVSQVALIVVITCFFAAGSALAQLPRRLPPVSDDSRTPAMDHLTYLYGENLGQWPNPVAGQVGPIDLGPYENFQTWTNSGLTTPKAVADNFVDCFDVNLAIDPNGPTNLRLEWTSQIYAAPQAGDISRQEQVFLYCRLWDDKNLDGNYCQNDAAECNFAQGYDTDEIFPCNNTEEGPNVVQNSVPPGAAESVTLDWQGIVAEVSYHGYISWEDDEAGARAPSSLQNDCVKLLIEVVTPKLSFATSLRRQSLNVEYSGYEGCQPPTPTPQARR